MMISFPLFLCLSFPLLNSILKNVLSIFLFSLNFLNLDELRYGYVDCFNFEVFIN